MHLIINILLHAVHVAVSQEIQMCYNLQRNKLVIDHGVVLVTCALSYLFMYVLATNNHCKTFPPLPFYFTGCHAVLTTTIKL